MTRKTTTTKCIVRDLGITTAIGTLGLLSRYPHSRYWDYTDVHDALTIYLGQEGRVLTEHYLAGFGLSAVLACSLFSLSSAVSGISTVISSFTGKDITPQRRTTVQDLFYTSSAVLGAALYTYFSYQYEQGQANGFHNGATGRGFLQYEQVIADIAGALSYVTFVGAQTFRSIKSCFTSKSSSLEQRLNEQ